MVEIDTLFQIKKAKKKHALGGGTYLYSLYQGLPPAGRKTRCRLWVSLLTQARLIIFFHRMILNTKRIHNSFGRNFPARAIQMSPKVLFVDKKKLRPRPFRPVIARSLTLTNKASLCGRPTTHEYITYPLTKCDNAGNSNQACNSCKGPRSVYRLSS